MTSILSRSDALIQRFNIKKIPRYSSVKKKEFWEDVYTKKEPCVLDGLEGEEFQKMLALWNSNFLREAVGNASVPVHVSSSSSLCFVPKNFEYKMMKISELLDEIEGKNSVLEENGGDAESDSKDTATSVEASLHTLKEDQQRFLYYRLVYVPKMTETFGDHEVYKRLLLELKLPEALEVPGERFYQFPYVMRVSQPGVQLWTHYDVPDNFLIQIRGFKRVFLFPPEEVMNLYISGSNSSSPIQGMVTSPDFENFPLLVVAMQKACYVDLLPGDSLFIPSCWPHAVCMMPLPSSCMDEAGASLPTLGEGEVSLSKEAASEPSVCVRTPEKSSSLRKACISVNAFFTDSELKDHGYHFSKDVYGNRDFNEAIFANKKLDQIVKDLSKLPAPYDSFYKLKLAAKLMESARPATA